MQFKEKSILHVFKFIKTSIIYKLEVLEIGFMKPNIFATYELLIKTSNIVILIQIN